MTRSLAERAGIKVAKTVAVVPRAWDRTHGILMSSTLPLQHYLASLHQKFAQMDGGLVATYIPELAKADPAWLGICIVTVDGFVYGVGDCDRAFTMQSVSKPVVYAAALADRGREYVLLVGEAPNRHPRSRGCLGP